MMKKAILVLTFSTVAFSAFANHPVAQTTAVANADHLVAVVAATGDNGSHPVVRTTAVATGDAAHPFVRTTVVANAAHPVAAAAVTGN